MDRSCRWAARNYDVLSPKDAYNPDNSCHIWPISKNESGKMIIFFNFAIYHVILFSNSYNSYFHRLGIYPRRQLHG